MVDINIKGVLYGIASALPVFRRQSFEHFVNTASTAGLITKPNQALYSGTKFAFALHFGGLAPRGGRQTAGDDRFARLRPDEFCGICGQSGGKSPDSRVDGQPCDSSGCRRPRHCVRDRAAWLTLMWARLSFVPPRTVDSASLNREICDRRVSSLSKLTGTVILHGTGR
jgi:hypothetical protein